ncbi:hypothetical protein M8C21_011148, partial [Ambrosia artemisiifolia]
EQGNFMGRNRLYDYFVNHKKESKITKVVVQVNGDHLRMVAPNVDRVLYVVLDGLVSFRTTQRKKFSF